MHGHTTESRTLRTDEKQVKGRTSKGSEDPPYCSFSQYYQQ